MSQEKNKRIKLDIQIEEDVAQGGRERGRYG